MGNEKLYKGVKAVSASSIEISFTYKGERCRERIRRKPTPANMKVIARHREAILDAIYLGTFNYAETFPKSVRAFDMSDVKGDAVMVRKYLWDWLRVKQIMTKASTYEGYKSIVKGVLSPWFGDLKLSEFSKRHMKEWAVQKNCSNKRISNVASVMRSALQDAVDDELIDNNPLFGWKFTRPEGITDAEADPFEMEEQAAIIEKLEGEAANYYQFAFWTGLRCSEQIPLQWSDIDWQKGTVKISKSQTNAAHALNKIETTKTVSSVRDVKLLEPALDVLRKQKELTGFDQSGLIFLDPRTRSQYKGTQALLKNYWIPALKRAKVRYRNQYQTRHTYGSMMVSAGENPVWVAKQMGHKDWSMITRIYGKWMKDANPEAGQKGVDAFYEKAVKIVSKRTQNHTE